MAPLGAEGRRRHPFGLAPASLCQDYEYADFIEHHVQIVSRSGDECMAYCFAPTHDNTRTPSMQVNVRTGQFICMNPDCGLRGGWRSLLRAFGIDPRTRHTVGLTVADLQRKLAVLNSGPEQDTQLAVQDESLLRRYAFPTDYWGRCPDDCPTLGRLCRMHRNLDPATIEAFDLGYDPMNNVATIPIRNVHGQLLGVIKRSLDPDENAGPKYRYPKGFRKSWEMFGSWFAAEATSEHAVVVEGSVDSMHVWQAGFCGLAQYGSLLSALQVRLIRMMGFTRVTMFCDNDRAGRAANWAAKGFTKRVVDGADKWEYNPTTDLRKWVLLYEAQYTPRMPDDPGKMDAEMIASAVMNARPIR